jgi:predicted ATP-grasp superfamily ATP-dependent carboligase
MRDPDGVLLTMGDYYGTLAAARCYGRAKIPVYLAESGHLTQTRWSRFVTETHRAPGLEDLNAFARWLVAFGKRKPGLFLYATSDDLAWLLASRRDELSQVYRMYQPPLSTIVTLLDKRRLYETCWQLGIDTPETRFPESEGSLEGLREEISFPVLIKPRTQMLLHSKQKGRLVRSRGELVEAYRHFRVENRYGSEVLAYDPGIGWPMLQRYHPEAMVDTYSMSGFIDETGELFVVRAARKIFKRPRQLGVGLCFVGEPVSPELRHKLFQLCRKIGYYGAFEAEFVRVPGEHLLIDFNPRFYGQMGFEVARGMPLPKFVYHAAHPLQGDALRAAVAHSVEQTNASTYHFSNRWVLELLMLTQTLSGRLSQAERRALQAILDDPEASYVDAVHDGADKGPLIADVLVSLKTFARHPRDFVKKFFLDA